MTFYHLTVCGCCVTDFPGHIQNTNPLAPETESVTDQMTDITKVPHGKLISFLSVLLIPIWVEGYLKIRIGSKTFASLKPTEHGSQKSWNSGHCA